MIKSSFREPLIVEFLDTDELKRFKIVSPFTYFIDRLGGSLKVDIPIGYLTDFASVPRPFWSIVPPLGRYGKATVVHDYLCEHKQAWRCDEEGNWIYYSVSRKEADEIFREAMKVLGVGKIKRNIMFRGVRIYSIFTGKK